MIFTYNGYPHAEYEVTVDVAKRGLENPSGFVYGESITLTITGILQGDSLPDLLTKQAALSNAYAIQNGNILWQSGSTTILNIQSDQTLYGVRVVKPPSFERGAAPGELVNRRQYQIVLEAAYLYDTSVGVNGDPYILDYESQLSTTGTGGPTFAHLPTITGRFQKQQLTETSVVTIQQSGRRVGILRYPTPDSPLAHLADFEKLDRRVIRQGNPRRINNNQIEYPIFWNYTFERNQPFPAAP